MTLSTEESVELFQRICKAIQSHKPLVTIKVMVAFHPKVLEMVDKENTTLLNLACYSSSPVQFDIFAYLVRQCPRSVQIPNHRVKSLPLHTACYHKASLRRVQLLYENYPNAAKMQNHDGRTPLSIATLVSTSFSVISYLANAWPVASLLSSDQGKLAWDSIDDKKLASNAITCLKETTVVASCALIDAIFSMGASMPWRVTCHIVEILSDFLLKIMKKEEVFCDMAISTLEIGKIQDLLADDTLQSWLKVFKHQSLVDGFMKMNAAGRSFLVEDPRNKLKDIAVMASVTSNLECLFLHLRSPLRISNVGRKFDVLERHVAFQIISDSRPRDGEVTIPLDLHTQSDSDIAETNDSEDSFIKIGNGFDSSSKIGDDIDSFTKIGDGIDSSNKIGDGIESSIKIEDGIDIGDGIDSSTSDACKYRSLQILVRNAGLYAVNGIYRQDGHYQGACRYTKTGRWSNQVANFYVFRCNVSDNTKHWCISVVPNGSMLGTGSDIDFYTAPATAEYRSIPPREGWIKTLVGKDPVPIVYY